jgi:hypothetical protein
MKLPRPRCSIGKRTELRRVSKQAAQGWKEKQRSANGESFSPLSSTELGRRWFGSARSLGPRAFAR